MEITNRNKRFLNVKQSSMLTKVGLLKKIFKMMKQKLSYLSRETAVESWRQGFYSSLFDLSKRRSSRYFHAGLSLVSKGKWVELICWSYFYSFCQFYAIRTHNKPTIRRSASNKVININENSNWNAHLLHSTKTQGVWGFSGILTCFPFISEERVWLFSTVASTDEDF